MWIEGDLGLCFAYTFIIVLFLQQILSVHITEWLSVSAQIKGNGVQKGTFSIPFLKIEIRALYPFGISLVRGQELHRG